MDNCHCGNTKKKNEEFCSECQEEIEKAEDRAEENFYETELRNYQLFKQMEWRNKI